MSAGETARTNRDSARQEVLERIRLRDNALLAYLGASGVVFSLALSKDTSSLLLLLVPYFSLGTAMIIAQHDAAIGSLCMFLTQELDPFVRELGEWAPTWESSVALFRFARKAIVFRTVSHSMLVVLPALLALALVRGDCFSAGVSATLAWWISATVVAALLAVVVDSHATRSRHYRDTAWVQPALRIGQERAAAGRAAPVAGAQPSLEQIASGRRIPHRPSKGEEA